MKRIELFCSRAIIVVGTVYCFNYAGALPVVSEVAAPAQAGGERRVRRVIRACFRVGAAPALVSI